MHIIYEFQQPSKTGLMNNLKKKSILPNDWKKKDFRCLVIQ